MLPLVLNLREKEVLVVGGGDAALHHAKRFIDEAQVTCLAPAYDPGFRDLPVVTVEADAGDGARLADLLESAFLVVAATDDPRENHRVAAAARDAGVLVLHTAHGDGDAGDAHLPTTVERGVLSIAVTTHGASPTLEAHVRDAIRREFGTEYGLMAELTARLRERLEARGASGAAVEEALRAALWDETVWDRLRAGDLDGALARVESAEGVAL